MKNTSKHFEHDALITDVRKALSKNISDKNKRKMSVLDCTMAGLALFTFKKPSLLRFDKDCREDETVKENLKNLFKLDEIPCDTYLRETLDQIDPDKLRSAYSALFTKIQRFKVLEKFVFLEEKINNIKSDKYYIISGDGTGFFSSNNIHCDTCCEKHHKDGSITYHHQMYGVSLVHPDIRVVIPFAFEPILKQDGNKKNDCEKNAAKRWIEKFRKEHPHLKVIFTADGLSPNAPFINLLHSNNMRYILTCKDNDHAYLLDYFNNCGKISFKKEDDSFIYEYSYMNEVPLNESNQDLLVNVVRLEKYNKQNRKKTSQCMFVTDFRLTKENIYQIIKGGKVRWKIENETFNTLKNQGYNFEHNYGHGKNNLSTVFAHLMVLAFFIDQILQLLNVSFKKAYEKIGAKYAIFEKMRGFITLIVFSSFKQLWNCILGPPKLKLIEIKD